MNSCQNEKNAPQNSLMITVRMLSYNINIPSSFVWWVMFLFTHNTYIFYVAYFDLFRFCHIGFLSFHMLKSTAFCIRSSVKWCGFNNKNNKMTAAKKVSLRNFGQKLIIRTQKKQTTAEKHMSRLNSNSRCREMSIRAVIHAEKETKNSNLNSNNNSQQKKRLVRFSRGNEAKC